MPATVTLSVTDGQLRGQQFVFDERTTCLLGKVKGCHSCLPYDADHGGLEGGRSNFKIGRGCRMRTPINSAANFEF